MKYHIGFKLLAFLLAACTLLTGAGALVLVVMNYQDNLYAHTPEELKEEALHEAAYSLADSVLNRYTAVSLGHCDQNQLAYVNRNYTDEALSDWNGVARGSWDYRITDLSGKNMESTYSGKVSGDIVTYTFSLSTTYPVHVTPEESALLETTDDWAYRDYYYTETEEHFLYYYESPVYHVTIRILPDALTYYRGMTLAAVEQLHGLRYYALAILGASVLVFLLCAIYLCCAAGRSHRHSEVRLKGLTKLPLDLYGVVAFFGCASLGIVGAELLDNVFFEETQYHLEALSVSVCAFGCACLLALLFLYAFVAQIKMKGGTWWRRSLIGWCLLKIWRGVKFCFRALRRLFAMLPLIWQWILTAAVMVILPLLCLFLAAVTYNIFRILFVLWFIMAFLLDVAMVCYGAYAFGILLKGAKAMSQGNLDAKIPTKYLFGSFREFADELNALAGAAMTTAKNQMKSERMKTELITNVSHDIKTPLTSLINYVDLLEKPHTEEEGRQYLEVLSRQSQRLKKLIDDLMDMSKATTGNMRVDLARLDAAEAVNQALGEYADKLETAGLSPVFRQPEEPVYMQADGRHTWRVLSNLLGNIVKYALPGTRVYMDLTRVENRVLVSLKNISREELNVSADELTERFVRGDASRNTEGSGLGLNIAKSLMELQGGQLQLLIDGDLFKVTLVFPAA